MIFETHYNNNNNLQQKNIIKKKNEENNINKETKFEVIGSHMTKINRKNSSSDL